MSWRVAYGLLVTTAALVWISAALTNADRRARQERECRGQTGRFALKVSSSEASGPSGAGSRARAGDRNPRRDFGIRLKVPKGYK